MDCLSRDVIVKNTFLEVGSPTIPQRVVRFASCPASFSLTDTRDTVSCVSTATVFSHSPDSHVPESFTTIMLRNIPNKYCQKLLLSAINSHGFTGKYDFFYL